MSGRYRIIALQAMGVAVLAVIVYLALLRPSEPDPLSGITGPGASQSAKGGAKPGEGETGARGPRRKRPGRAIAGRRGGLGPSAAAQVGAIASGAPRGGTPGVATGPAPVGPGSEGGLEPPGDPDTPPGSEYQDAVARITAKLEE